MGSTCRLPGYSCRFWPLLALVAALLSGPIGALASDGRIPIYQPTTIGSSGSYYLTRDLDGSSVSGAVITITANAVTLDLGGHYIEVGSGNVGIDIINGADVRVMNGTIADGPIGFRAKSWGTVHVDHVMFMYQNTNAIYVERSTLGNEIQPVIEHCKFTLCHSPIYLSFCMAGKVAENEFVSSNGSSIHLSNCAGNAIARNTISASTEGGGIYLEYSSGNSITNNLVSTNSGGTSHVAYYLYSSSYNTVADNTATFAQGTNSDNYWFLQSSYNTVVRNSAEGGGVGFTFSTSSPFNTVSQNTATGGGGFFFADSSGSCRITENSSVGSSISGFTIASSSNMISHNNASGCGSDGFFVSGNDNAIDWNVASGNAQHGILAAGTGNVLSSNRCLGNGAGPWSVSCSTNTCVQYSSGYPTNIPGP